jgi:hypothetical protein
VPDDRFRWLCDTYQPKSSVSAYLEICDIAGLVRGAAQGEGLGNAFLSHIAAVDGIYHVCRAFEVRRAFCVCCVCVLCVWRQRARGAAAAFGGCCWLRCCALARALLAVCKSGDAA